MAPSACDSEDRGTLRPDTMPEAVALKLNVARDDGPGGEPRGSVGLLPISSEWGA